MRSRPESSIILLIILIAIILAIGVFLFISLLIGRSEAAAETAVSAPESQPFTVLVEDQIITLLVDPNLRPVVIPPTAVPAPPAETQPEAGQPQDGAQPAAQPEAGQSQEGAQPAAQPETLPQPIGGQPGNRLIFIDYVVVQGDTLYRIQEKQITSIALMAKHGIDAGDIVVGNVLRLPVGNSAACNGWRAYVVLKGDTSFGISQRAGISLEEFGLRNGLDANYSIYETDIVCIP